MTCASMLRFTRHYKDTIQDRLTILVSLCSKFIGVHMCQIKIELNWFDKVIAKINWCSFFYSQCNIGLWSGQLGVT